MYTFMYASASASVFASVSACFNVHVYVYVCMHMSMYMYMYMYLLDSCLQQDACIFRCVLWHARGSRCPAGPSTQIQGTWVSKVITQTNGVWTLHCGTQAIVLGTLAVIITPPDDENLPGPTQVLRTEEGWSELVKSGLLSENRAKTQSQMAR